MALLIFLLFLLLGVCCIEFLIIVKQFIKYQELRIFLKKYNTQMEALIFINRHLQQTLDELREVNDGNI